MDPMTTGPAPAPTPQSSAPMTPPPATPTPGKGSMGPVAAVVVILALIIVGALYFYGKNEWNTGSADTTELDAISETSSSDALADIEADLGATETENLDAELGQLEATY